MTIGIITNDDDFWEVNKKHFLKRHPMISMLNKNRIDAVGGDIMLRIRPDHMTEDGCSWAFDCIFANPPIALP